MARMQSGDTFPEFDMMTDTESKTRIQAIEKAVGVVKSEYLPIKTFDEYKESAQKQNQGLVDDIAALSGYTKQVNENINTVVEFLNPLLNSKFIRFLNFFGKWYIYSQDGTIYLNIPKYQKYRKAPWYVRMTKRWEHFWSKDKTDSSDT